MFCLTKALTRVARQSSSLSASMSSSIDLTGKFQLHNIEMDESHLTAEVTADELFEAFEKMYTIRRMEITCDTEYKARNIRGFCHLSDGQEAIPVGMDTALTHNDGIITSYRCHGQAFVRGQSVEQILAELFGRETGAMGGKGGSMHLYNKDSHFYGGAGIVGAQVPIGAGLAFSAKYNHDESSGELCPVGIGMYGDGAANQGQIWEAANMSKLWKLPAVFVCENNRYGMGTTAERSSANTEYYKQGGVIIPGIKADGMDYLAVRECFKFIKEFCGNGGGPIFCELATYRYHGHSMSDAGLYRDRQEVQEIRAARDPIEQVKKNIVELGFMTEQELQTEEKRIKKEVAVANKNAKAGAEPAAGELITDIFSDGKGGSEIPPFIRMPRFDQSLTTPAN